MSYKNNIKYKLKSFWHFVKALAVSHSNQKVLWNWLCYQNLTLSANNVWTAQRSFSCSVENQNYMYKYIVKNAKI